MFLDVYVHAYVSVHMCVCACARVLVYMSMQVTGVRVLMEDKRKSQSPGAVIIVANGCEFPDVSETIKCRFFFKENGAINYRVTSSFQFSIDYINEYSMNYINSSE